MIYLLSDYLNNSVITLVVSARLCMNACLTEMIFAATNLIKTFPQVLKKADMIRKNAVESILAERNILISVRNPFVVSRSQNVQSF